MLPVIQQAGASPEGNILQLQYVIQIFMLFVLCQRRIYKG